MTNQEAAEMIRNDMKLRHDSLSGGYRKVLSMAISALEAQKLSNNSPKLDSGNGEFATNLKPTCKQDLISRQAAIDELVKMLSYCFQVDEEEIDAVETTLKNLPTVEPEIVRCKDCRHNHNCDIQYHAQGGDLFYCGAAERRPDGKTA